MKNILFIITLLFGMLLLIPEEGISNDIVQDLSQQKEVVMEENNVTDIQHRLEILSNDLKGSNCLTPRRVVQSTTNTFHIRLLKIEEKAYQFLGLREKNLLLRISEEVVTFQTINISCLLCCSGYLVYALRKIII